MSKTRPVIVEVTYHPRKPLDLESKYPAHLNKPGVAKLIKACQSVYSAGKVVGEGNLKDATRIALFIFPSKKAWEEVVKDPDVRAVLADASDISGPNGLSIVVAEADVIKEPAFDPRGPGSQN